MYLAMKYIGLDHNYYLTDEQGSVRYVLDAAGNVQNDYRYDAFDQRIAGQENIPNRLRYNAQIEDDLTGLYYLRARYYNTGIGRFTQEDVIYNDGLKSSKNAIYDPKSGKKFKYSDSSIRPSYGANQVQTVWDRAVVKDPSSSHYGQVYDKKIISGCHGINQNHVKDSGIWSI